MSFLGNAKSAILFFGYPIGRFEKCPQTDSAELTKWCNMTEQGKLTNAKYQELNAVGKTAATEELQDLMEKGLIIQNGTKGRGSKYILK